MLHFILQKLVLSSFDYSVAPC